MSDFLTIGIFAQLTRLTPKALRLYDEQGLLRPVHVDRRSGYRYYSLSQVAEAERIRQLKAVGMPLAGIQQFLRATDSAERDRILRRHRDRLASEESALRQAREALEVMRSRPLSLYEVALKLVGAQVYLGIRQLCPPEAICAVIAQAQADLGRFLGDQLAEASGPVTVVYHEPDTEGHPDTWEVEVCQPYHTEFPLCVQAPLHIGTLPVCTVAFTVHSGPYNGYDGLEGAYAALWRWVCERGWLTVGPPREVYLFDPHNTEQPEDYRTEIAWPVSPQAGP